MFLLLSFRHLHSPCNFLIASSSFCIAHWQMNWMVAFIFVELDADVISKSFCIGMQAYLVSFRTFLPSLDTKIIVNIQVSCVQGMNILILCIALDRLLNVAFPTWYGFLNKKLYVMGIVFFCNYIVLMQRKSYSNMAGSIMFVCCV